MTADYHVQIKMRFYFLRMQMTLDFFGLFLFLYKQKYLVEK